MQPITLSTTEGTYSNNLKCKQCGNYFKSTNNFATFAYIGNGQMICLELCSRCEKNEANTSTNI